ncbi:MAG: hypothetical protein C4567_08870 [Deltaproteobacteria bacterium]|nr:MAG: hypothetical protein C4567_08870 [Deltaproteobacteria bacterium]
MKGLFNKIKNLPTRRRFVISTICKDENAFETAIFEANFFYLPKSWSKPALVVLTETKDQAWDTHHLLAARLKKEYPIRVFQEYSCVA